MNNSESLKTLTVLHRHHHYLVPELDHHSKLKAHNKEAAISLPLAATALRSVSVDFLLWIFSLHGIIQHVAFESDIFTLHNVDFHCVDHSTFCLFSHQLMDFWLFLLCSYCE